MNQEIIQKIRWLQRAEGHKPCFRSGRIVCEYADNCCYKEICDYEMSIKPLITFEVVE